MKKILTILLVSLTITAFSQPGSQSVSGIKFRVNDTTSYQAAGVTAHAQGYADIYWNNQATTPHFDIWNGISYDHVFNFSGGSTYTASNGITKVGNDFRSGGPVTTGITYTDPDTLGVSYGFNSFDPTGGSGTFYVDIKNEGGNRMRLEQTAYSFNLTEYSLGFPAPIQIDADQERFATFKYDLALNKSFVGSLEIPHTISANGIFVANTANTLTELVPLAGQSIRRNAGNTAWEAYTPGGGGTWGSITGTLSSQTDLQTALDTKSEKLLSYVTYTANHTLSLASDLNKVIIVNTTTGNVSLTIPTNGTEAFPVGYQLVILHIDSNVTPNTLTIVASGGVTVVASNSALTSPLSEAGSVFLYADKRLTDTWDLANGIAGAAGGGTVTSVGFTGGIISVATPTTTPALTVAGTSGGIPYFSSASTWATSAALAANSLVVGGGAGVAPSTTTTGTGVVTALGVNVGSAGAVVVNGGALGTPSSGTATNLTGTASGLTAGNVTTNANLTGHVTSVGNATTLGSFSSADLRTALTDENGTGAALFSGSTTPDFTTGFTIGGAATSRKILVGNGTNFVPSTETWAVPGTSGNTLISDGTNWTSVTNPAWLLASGGTLTGSNTITSNTRNQLNFGGTWTATSDLDYHIKINPTITGDGTNGHIVSDLSLTGTTTAGANSQILNGIFINKTFSTGGFSSVVTNAILTRGGNIRVDNSGGTQLFNLGTNGLFTIGSQVNTYIGQSASGGGIRFANTGYTASGATDVRYLYDFLPITTTTVNSNNGEATYIRGRFNFAASSQNATFRVIDLNGTWNTTGTYSGLGYIIDYDPVLPSTTGLTVLATRFSSGVHLWGGTTITANTRFDLRGTGTSTNINQRWANSSNTLTAHVLDNGEWYMLNKIKFETTITAGGTTGNQTIDKPSGTVNIAAAGTTVTVTNSLCTSSSIVIAVVRTNDATCYVKNVVPGAGSFVINLGAAATAEVSIGFIVYN